MLHVNRGRLVCSFPHNQDAGCTLYWGWGSVSVCLLHNGFATMVLDLDLLY